MSSFKLNRATWHSLAARLKPAKQRLAPVAEQLAPTVEKAKQRAKPLVRRFLSLFTKHPAAAGETYWQHMGMALGYALRLGGGALAATIHALFPFLFEDTTSRMISKMHDEMSARINGAQTNAQASNRAQANSDASPDASASSAAPSNSDVT